MHEGHFITEFDTSLVEIQNPSSTSFSFKAIVQTQTSLKEIPVDMVVLAGGSNNPVRDRYLSPASAQTDKKSHSISVWNKSIPGSTLLKNTQDFRVKLSNSEISAAVASQNIDNFILNFINTPDIKPHLGSKYSTPMSTLILQDTSENEIDIRQFENRDSVYLAYKAPNKMGDLRLDIENLILNESNQAKKDIFTKFLKDLETQWHFAGMRTLTHHSDTLPSKRLQPDPAPISHGSFYVEQVTSKHTVKVYHARNGSFLIIAAVGDSVVSPHFMTWSGLNCGRGTSKRFYRSYFKI